MGDMAMGGQCCNNRWDSTSSRSCGVSMARKDRQRRAPPACDRFVAHVALQIGDRGLDATDLSK